MILQATHNVHHLVVNSVDCDPDIQVQTSYICPASFSYPHTPSC